MKKLFAIALLASTGCFTPAQQPTVNAVECIAKALVPYAVADAHALAKDITDGNISTQDVVDILGLGVQAANEFKDAYATCVGHPLLLKSPPPAYGDKVL